MSERQLADEYRSRERGHQLRREELDTVWDSVRQACGTSSDNQWVIAVLQPERPGRVSRDRLPGRVKAAMDSCVAHRLAASDHGAGFGVSAIDITAGRDIRRGLRMMYRATPPHSNAGARFEIHGDGSVVLGVHRSAGAFRDGMASAGDVAVCDIEQIGLDLAISYLATRDRFGNSGDYTLRLGISPGTQIFRRSDYVLKDHFRPWDEAERITNFRTVEGSVTAGSRLDAVTDILELAQDAVHQTGAVPSYTPGDVMTALQAE